MLIYSYTITPRLQFVADFLSQYFGHSFQVTTDWQFFLHSDKPRINYAATNAEARLLWIKPHGLLSSTSIKEIDITCFDHVNGYKAFFKTEGYPGFDLFAAIFYLLSRYEEYRPHQKDEYGRFAYQNSIAYKNDFLQLPLVNVWLEDFRRILTDNFPNIRFPIPSFQFLPTYDIDIAWSYKNKGVLRNIGGAMKSILGGQWAMVKERGIVLTGKQQDPFDSYEWLHEQHERHGLQPIYFFHVGQRRNTYDKNIASSSTAFQQLVKQHIQRYRIGVHPSWHSGDEPSAIKGEKILLERIIAEPITDSRQHYIRFTVPHTFRQLLAAGITNDYSMGYGSINGFRASVATPFYWYDLEREEKTNLLLHPFCFMDANALFEQKQTPEQALLEMKYYYEAVRKVNGTFITIWHNNFLGTDPLYKGWREAYGTFLQQIMNK